MRRRRGRRWSWRSTWPAAAAVSQGRRRPASPSPCSTPPPVSASAPSSSGGPSARPVCRDQVTRTKTLNLLHTLLHKATIGMRELVRAETDTRLALYDYVRDIHINVPQIIFNIVSRLHQYSPNIPTIVNIRILHSIC